MQKLKKYQRNKSLGKFGAGSTRQHLSKLKCTNVVGAASIIMLALLALHTITPSVVDGVNAEEITSSGAMSYAAVVNPVLSIALDSNVSVELNPTTDGDFKNSVARLSVSTNNTSGYRIMMGSGDASNSLTSPDGGTIPSITGTVSSGSFPKDQWGYSLAVGSETASNYNAIPTATTDIKKVDTGDVTAGLVDDYTLNFGTKVTPSIPAGVYSKTMIVSVVANPAELRTLTNLTNMQDINSKICANTPPETSTQLKDTRDNKWYWVTKLKDGNCWMTQNLDWDIPATVDATVAAQSDNIPERWKPTEATITNHNYDVGTAQTNSYSWDEGNLVVLDSANNSTACSNVASGMALSSTNCNRVKASVSLVGSTIPSNVAGNQELHQHIGNYYQYNAATADTGKNLTGGNASGSICPKGWKLPMSGNSNNGSFDYLINTVYKYAATKDLASGSMYFQRSGYINPDDKYIKDIGYSGDYWSSTINFGIYVYSFYFSDISSISPLDNYVRYGGLSVRCVVSGV